MSTMPASLDLGDGAANRRDAGQGAGGVDHVGAVSSSDGKGLRKILKKAIYCPSCRRVLAEGEGPPILVTCGTCALSMEFPTQKKGAKK